MHLHRQRVLLRDSQPGNNPTTSNPNRRRVERDETPSFPAPNQMIDYTVGQNFMVIRIFGNISDGSFINSVNMYFAEMNSDGFVQCPRQCPSNDQRWVSTASNVLTAENNRTGGIRLTGPPSILLPLRNHFRGMHEKL